MAGKTRLDVENYWVITMNKIEPGVIAMDFLNLVKMRQSVRDYSEQPVERAKIEKCAEHFCLQAAEKVWDHAFWVGLMKKVSNGSYKYLIPNESI